MNANSTSTTKQDKPVSVRMQKRVETKEDGRLLVYYTFDEQAPTQAQTQQDKATKR